MDYSIIFYSINLWALDFWMVCLCSGARGVQQAYRNYRLRYPDAARYFRKLAIRIPATNLASGWTFSTAVHWFSTI
jgi:hypothetical protein